MRRWALVIVLAVWGGAAGPPAGAQSIRLSMDDAPLIEALDTLRVQAGIDVVYARRLTDGRRVSCRYRGERTDEALACLLSGTGLHADRVRRKQYVLVAGTAAAADSTRGAVAGTVVDASTGELLPGAHVYLPALRAGTVANETGYFVLPGLPEGRYVVRVSYVGYQARDTILTTTADRRARLALRPTTLEAEHVTVAADPSEARTSVQAGTRSLSAGELERLPSFVGEQDLFRSLRQLPGVYKAAGLQGGLSVRGGGTDQNLYLLDGAPVYHPWHAFSLISTFQTETFRRVRLYRGSFPAEYGGRLSSVLHAQLKDGGRDQPHAQFSLSPISGRFLLESPLARDMSFMLAGRRSYLDKLIGREHPVEDAQGRRDTLRTGYHFSDLSAKLSAKIDARHRLSISYYRGRDDLDLRLPFDLSLDLSSWLRPADLFFEVGQGWSNEVISLQHRYLVSDQVFITFTGYRSDYWAEERAFVRPAGSIFVGSDYGVRLRDLGFDADVDYYYSLAHQLRMGLQVVRQSFASDLRATVTRAPQVTTLEDERSTQEATEVVGYVQDRWTPNGRLTVQPGVRVSYLSSGQHLWVRPRLSVQYVVHPEYLTLRGAAGTHVQHVQRLRDRYSLVYDLVSSRWVPASDHVPPARGEQVSLEVETQPSEGLMFQLSAYARQARDVLVPEDRYRIKDGLEGPGIAVGSLLGQYVTAQTRGVGAELEALLQHGHWGAGLSYAASRSAVRAPALEETTFHADDFDLPHALRATATYDGPAWTAALALMLRSGYPITVPKGRYVLSDPLDDAPTYYLSRPYPNNGRLPPYARLDASLGRRFEWLDARWHVQLHLYNALNRRSVVARQYVPGHDVEVNNRRSVPLLPLFELNLSL